MRFKLKKASLEDANFCYELRNEIDTRKNSFNQKKIKTHAHLKWYIDKIKDKNTIFLIASIKKNERIGIIRYDIQNKIFEVSINIHKKFRNLSYGSKILKKSEVFLKKKSFIISKIKKSNKSSLKIFKRNNYKIIDKNNKFLLIKII